MTAGTVGLTAGAATVIAIAGGSGAFLGAVAGQAIQAVRDRTQRRTEDRRRREDREAEKAKELREFSRSKLSKAVGLAADIGRNASYASQLKWEEKDDKGKYADSDDWYKYAVAILRLANKVDDLANVAGSLALQIRTKQLAAAIMFSMRYSPASGRMYGYLEYAGPGKIAARELTEPITDFDDIVSKMRISARIICRLTYEVEYQLRAEIGLDENRPAWPEWILDLPPGYEQMSDEEFITGAELPVSTVSKDAEPAE